MAVYKVPQDVEADDKLLGPLSFRQFIYATIAVIGCAVAFFLSQIFIPLIIIPLPIIILFGALALPLRKDQPMEMYLIAIIRFMLKPRLRLWQPEGAVAMVEIVAPRVVEEQRTNGLSQDQARSQLEYLAQLMDTRGWAAKGATYPGAQHIAGPPMIADSDISNDIMDIDASVARNFDNLIAKKKVQRQQEVRQQLQQTSRQAAVASQLAASAPEPTRPVSLDEIITQQQQIAPAQLATPYNISAATPNEQPSSTDDNVRFDYNPYPKNIHQQVVQPLDPRHQQRAAEPEPDAMAQPESNSMTTSVSPDIMRLALAESKNLSISTLANEAHRLERKQDENEVVVSLHPR